MKRRQRRIGHTETSVGQVDDAEQGSVQHGRQSGFGYLPERPDAVRRTDRKDVRVADRNGRIPEYDRKLGNSRRRLPLRSVQRGTVRRPLDHGGRRDQATRRADATTEPRDQRNGDVRGSRQ